MMNNTRTMENGSLLADESTPLAPRRKDVVSTRPERPKGLGSRHTLTFLVFLGFINVYSMRVGLSVAMVAMVNSTSSSSSSHHLPSRNISQTVPPGTSEKRLWDSNLYSNGQNNGIANNKDNEAEQQGTTLVFYKEGLGLGKDDNGSCPIPSGRENATKDKPGEFNWDEQTQGNILGAFFYGYMFSQIPGGYLANRFGGKKIFGLSVFFTAVLSLLTPVAARTSLYLVIALRVMCGLVQGMTYPATHSMFGVWAPEFERSSLVVLSYAGNDLGTVLSLAVSGVLCDSDIAGGWPSVFYIFGSLGALWTVFWVIFVYDSPATHPWISEAERTYIEGSIGKLVQAPSNPPWRQILTSPAVWAITAAQFSSNWGLYIFLTCLPTYMEQILKFDIKTNGYLSAIPYAFSWISKSVIATIADAVRKRNYLSTKNTRKLFQTLGCLVPAGLVLLVGYVGCNHLAAVLTLTLYMGFRGMVTSGFSVNHLDIAPKFSGILMATTNTFGTIPGFVSPLLVGALTNNNQTRGQWQIVFYVTAAVLVAGASVFLVLAQGEVLPWGELDTTPDVTRDKPSVNSSNEDTNREYQEDSGRRNN